MVAAPLLISADLSHGIDNDTLSILSAPEIVAVDQDAMGVQGVRVSAHNPDGPECWARPLHDGGAAALLLNRALSAGRVTCSWVELGFPAKAKLRVRDLWLREELGDFAGSYSAVLAGHSSVLVKVTKQAANVSKTDDTPTQRELPTGGRFVGLNVVQTQSWSGSWTDSAYTAGVSTRLLPGFLRYPGGTVGNYWDWKTGWFLTDVNWTASNVAWYANIEKRPYTLSDFVIGVRATGATPVLSLNMLTSNLSYQLAGLHAAAALGLNVSVVELVRCHDYMHCWHLGCILLKMPAMPAIISLRAGERDVRIGRRRRRSLPHGGRLRRGS